MKTGLKKTIVFGVIISFLTSAYAAFLKTIMNQSFLSDHFLINWLKEIPKFYLFILPFVLITGPVVRILVDNIFRNEKK
jgi:uncharacterized membrane protein